MEGGADKNDTLRKGILSFCVILDFTTSFLQKFEIKTKVNYYWKQKSSRISEDNYRRKV
jgi:hypothetical protein